MKSLTALSIKQTLRRITPAILAARDLRPIVKETGFARRRIAM